MLITRCWSAAGSAEYSRRLVYSRRAYCAMPNCRPGASDRRVLCGLLASLAHRGQELPSFFEEPLRFLDRRQHLFHRLENVARAKIEAAVETLDRAVDLVIAEPRVSDGALLITGFVEQRINREKTILRDVIEKFGARVRRGERDLDRFAIHFARKANRFLDRVLALARQTENKRAVNQDADVAAILGEAAGAIDADTFFDVLQNLRVAGFVADHEQAEPPVFHDLEGLVIDVGA